MSDHRGGFGTLIFEMISLPRLSVTIWFGRPGMVVKYVIDNAACNAISYIHLEACPERISYLPGQRSKVGEVFLRNSMKVEFKNSFRVHDAQR